MTAIRCAGLSRRYDDVEALKPLDLAVQSGSVFGFLGRNGAGKTTTIRLMTGLAKPTTGSAWVAGVSTTDGNVVARAKFGYLPEEPAFYSWMTPREYLEYIGRLFGIESKDRHSRIDELLELVDLQEAGKRRIGGFSRGMRQRLGLAQALIHRPPVLFLDEPTSALDPAGRRKVLDLIESLRGDTTIFLSSHILADVERVCETIGVIHEGQLLTVAGREELLSSYATNTVLLEFDRATLPLSDRFLSQLRNLPWITNIIAEESGLRLSVSDVDKSKKELLALIVDSGLVLDRYEWVQPTLEEVFLALSA